MQVVGQEVWQLPLLFLSEVALPSEMWGKDVVMKDHSKCSLNLATCYVCTGCPLSHFLTFISFNLYLIF